MEHLNLGLPSSLGSELHNTGSGLPSAQGSRDESAALLVDISPKLSPPHLEMHFTSANGDVEKAVHAIFLESPSQNVVNNSNLKILMQMSPQFQQEGISKVLQSCDNKLYDTVDQLLKLLPEESRRRDSPNPVISFSQTVTKAVSHIHTNRVLLP